MILTTPHQRGPAVLAAQKLLQHNHWGVFLDGGEKALDGEYGPHTAQAVYRAKFWLGWRVKRLNHAYGPALEHLLEAPKLPLANRLRRRWRLLALEHRKHLTPKRVLALRKALAYVGTHEQPPGSNDTAFGEWYGANGEPWCAMFVSYCGWLAGQHSFAPGRHYAYCPYIVDDARAGRNGLTVTRDPQLGDLAPYGWGTQFAQHVGRFIRWIDQAAGTFQAVEGNTSLEGDTTGSQSDGGIVAIRTRHVSDVVCFVRVAEH